MTHQAFLEEVICGGIEAVKASYADGSQKQEGSLAGFEACRGKDRDSLAALLYQAQEKANREFADDSPDYWKARCFCAEVEWVCNCYSAILALERMPTIVHVTVRGANRAFEILRAENIELPMKGGMGGPILTR